MHEHLPSLAFPLGWEHCVAWTYDFREIERYTYKTNTYELRVDVSPAIGGGVTAAVSVSRKGRDRKVVVHSLAKEDAADHLTVAELALRRALQRAKSVEFRSFLVAPCTDAIQSLTCYRFVLVSQPKRIPALA